MYAHPLTYQVRVEAHHDQGLSPQEESWRSTRGKQVMTALQDYLNTANISDFDIQGYMDKLNEAQCPLSACPYLVAEHSLESAAGCLAGLRR